MNERDVHAGTNRFERTWNDWDEALRNGKQPSELLTELPSETILQLLAGAGNVRRYERDILATEAMNRLTRTRRELDEAVEEVADLMTEVEDQGDRARKDVHATEETVARLQGSETLGADTPQEITAHHASDLIENLADTLHRVDSALERLEIARRKDLERAEGGGSDEDSEAS